MIKKTSVIIAFYVALTSCGSSGNQTEGGQVNMSSHKSGKQLNISILWDLSDRINPTLHKEMPPIADRDIAIIKYFANFFKADMDKKGAYLAKGKLKVFFSPNPSDPNINLLASKLDVDLSNKGAKEKKKIYEEISEDFEQSAKQIADITVNTSKWEGSDIYRFFKNDVDYCISKDTSYRNILVILTDGYVYDAQSKKMYGNKSTYITGPLLSSLGLRDNRDFKSTFQSKNCGLIATGKDLNELEVLVLEINSNIGHKDDEDIIKLYFESWFNEMNVRRKEIFNTDLPENMKERISYFLGV